MSRELLSEATSIHEGTVPVYLLDQISRTWHQDDRRGRRRALDTLVQRRGCVGQLGANDGAGEKMADYLLGRMGKSNMNVKLKAMQVINHSLKAGDNAFNHFIRQDEANIRALSNFQGQIDPAYGDEKNRRVRMAALEMLNYLGLPTNFAAGSSAAPPPPSTFMPQAYSSNAPTNSSQTTTWGNPPPPAQQQQSTQWSNPTHNAPARQGSQYGSNSSAGVGGGGGPWGREPSGPPASYGNSSNPQPPQYGNSSAPQYGQPPAPYRDSPAQYGNDQQPPQYGQPPPPAYGGPQSTYNPTSQQYGGPSQSQYGSNTQQQQYGGSNTQQQQYGGSNTQQQQYGGSNNVPDYGNPTGGAPAENPSWRGSVASNSSAGGGRNATGVWGKSGYEKKEPTAQEMIPTRWSTARDNRPTVLVGGKSSLFAPGKPAAPPVGGFGVNRMGSSGHMGGMSGGFQPPPGPPPMMSSSNMGGGGFNGRPSSSQPVFDRPKSKIEETLDVVQKKGFQLKDMWDRRNMDKSMASSLAEHDDYVNTNASLDSRGQTYQPQAPTGSSDKSSQILMDATFDWEYERSLIDDLCPPGGLARAPPAENLKRFVDLAKTLDMTIVGDLLLDKLEDESWQVRLKGLCVWESLLEAPGCSQYGQWLEENIELLQHVGQDPKSHVATKAKRILQLIGVEAAHQPVAAPAAHKHKHAQQQQPVDLLALGDMSLGDAQPQGFLQPGVHQPSFQQPGGFQQPQVAQGGFPQGFAQQQPLPPSSFQQMPQAAAAAPPANLLDLSFSPVKSATPTPTTALDPLSLSSLPPNASRSIGDFGKDLFTLANSPRAASTPTQPSQPSIFQTASPAAAQAPPPATAAQKSAFSFM
ncbi:Aste57867_19954 [Aphanomyces stellatus]|uniref:Aste57867_19954 protein n=1 Tax=Aphanomyces stellatus TaxID=120398 RepID=A0A485LEJ5_9STRA|nr:hypothetical protein As57867_019888 [Aphanomyces stellatus]VFT96651.1 Aste57867_19954 [Aphanomyces stellatus]